MSRFETLKKQFPHLSISILDILKEIDGTESYKYLQLLCKLFKLPELGSDNEINERLNNLQLKVSDNHMVNNTKIRLTEYFRESDIHTFNKFKEYNERGLVNQKDITKYSNFSDLSAAISLAEIKEYQKINEKKTIREFEDDKWLIVKPLSFESSIKYGSNTRWCTTYKHEKEYFFKYCQNGMLLYVINKETGVKFAMFHDLTTKKPETSFWDCEDVRQDLIDLDIDDYIISELRKMKRSAKKNIEYLTKSEILELATECHCIHRLSDYNDVKLHALDPELRLNDYVAREEMRLEPVPNMTA